MPSQPALDFSGRNWPDPLQLLLLRACLDAGDEAVAAWREWQQRIALDDIDYASLRLIPLLSHRLRSMGAAGPDSGRYLGIQRKSWYETQMAFRRASEVTRLCQSAGIPIMVLKGIPLASLYYPAKELRPMADFDFLVRPGDVERTTAALEAAGWQRMRLSFSLRTGKELAFRHPTLGEADLHWRILGSTYQRTAEEKYWAAARPFQLGGFPLLTLNSTDLLYHVCIHGVPANTVAPMRWIVDALMILRKDTIDWTRLLGHMETECTGVMLHHAFVFLRRHFTAPIPDHVIASIAAAQVQKWESAELRSAGETGFASLYRQILWFEFQRYRRTALDDCPRSLLPAYLAYVHARLDTNRWSEIARLVATKLLNHLRIHLGRAGQGFGLRRRPVQPRMPARSQGSSQPASGT